jgi:cobalamin biosynthetic protein CobC
VSAPLLQHGGRLRAAAIDYGIPLTDWLDLSTGINPTPYPTPAIPAEVWQRLPEDEDDLPAIAAAAYGCPAPALPLPGSQAAIQALPAVLAALTSPAASFPRTRESTLSVGVDSRLRGNDGLGGAPLTSVPLAIAAPTYAEHPAAWTRAGHPLQPLPLADFAHAITANSKLRLALLVQPNNPTGERLPAAELLAIADTLAARGGWLIVDEAFADADGPSPLAAVAGAHPGLLVLRSLGKFFGLAGARVGFLLGPAAVREELARQLGPWPVNGPARWLAARALADADWQAEQRRQLTTASERLATLLAPLTANGQAAAGCALFRWLPLPDSRTTAALAKHCARRGILLRRFDPTDPYPAPPALRFGLPPDEAGWSRLTAALHDWLSEKHTRP